VSRGLAVVLTAAVGGLVAIQAPINSQLGKRVGTYQGALVSFAVGTALLTLIVLIAGGGIGKVAEARHVAWYYLLGGVLGAAYVSCVLVTVRTLGAGGVTGATIAGQLAMSVALDRSGALGLAQRSITPGRMVGIALLAAGTFLVVTK
jgi:transporter family-2 protein